MKPKDPNRPRPPTTAYFMFMNDERPKLKDKPEFKKKSVKGNKMVTDVPKLGTELGKRWRELSPERKDYYLKTAKEKKVFTYFLEQFLFPPFW